MNLTKEQLEKKIAELNKWLLNNQFALKRLIKEKEHYRNYYVNKLIEL